MIPKSTEEWSVYFGNPAKRLKSREKALLALEADYLAAERNRAGSGEPA